MRCRHVEGTGSVNRVEEHDLIAVEDPGDGGLPGCLHEVLQNRAGHVLQRKPRDSEVSQIEQMQAQVIAAGGVLADEAVVVERHQDPMSRALVQPRALRDRLNRELAFTPGEAVEDLDGAVDRLNPIAPRPIRRRWRS